MNHLGAAVAGGVVVVAMDAEGREGDAVVGVLIVDEPGAGVVGSKATGRRKSQCAQLDSSDQT